MAGKQGLSAFAAAAAAVVVFLLGLCGLCSSTSPGYEPQQVHISTGSSSEMTVVWNTLNDTGDSRVLFGEAKGVWRHEANGTRVKFVDGGVEKRTQFIHTVVLTGLANTTVYFYVVGSKTYGFSEDVFSFKTWPAGENWSPRMAIYGDMGSANAQSLSRLKTDTARGMYDSILHVGDFAYNMETQNAKVGDEFMRQIEPMASSIPYMTCPGNHEGAYNFSNYKNRFRMPGDLDQRMYYSYTMGPARIISTATELIFFPQYGLVPIVEHYKWLENELKEANKPENRATHPWVITIGHRPMYCSNNNNNDCTRHESLIRTGIPLLHLLGWEKLFYDNGVDIAIWAHEHSYERLWPVYNRKVMNGSYAHPYTNPKAPVHIITGSAGCDEFHDPFDKVVDDWSAFRSDDYGYTRMQVYNTTHLYMEQVSDDKGGVVIDKVMVIKDKHGPYEYDPTPVKPVSDQSDLIDQWRKLASTGRNQDLP